MTEPELGEGRIWWILALIFGSGWCLFLYCYGPTVPLEPPVLDGTVLGRPADYDWTLHDLEGRPVSFAQFRGKPVFLNVWATDCPPCLEELPSIDRLARSPRLARVAFVGVSTDADAETVRRFLRGKDWPMTFLHAGPTGLPDVFTAEGGGIPATYLIAPDGRIAASSVGASNWDDPSVVDFLERLEGAKPGEGTPTKAKPHAPATPP
jgi:thiol-disulfide isomerase/thioredoxin